MHLALTLVLWLVGAAALVAAGLGAIGWWQLSKTQPSDDE